jgi:hypothetical protein
MKREQSKVFKSSKVVVLYWVIFFDEQLVSEVYSTVPSSDKTSFQFQFKIMKYNISATLEVYIIYF